VGGAQNAWWGSNKILYFSSGCDYANDLKLQNFALISILPKSQIPNIVMCKDNKENHGSYDVFVWLTNNLNERTQKVISYISTSSYTIQRVCSPHVHGHHLVFKLTTTQMFIWHWEMWWAQQINDRILHCLLKHDKYNNIKDILSDTRNPDPLERALEVPF
jgi:hypothetical protein